MKILLIAFLTLPALAANTTIVDRVSTMRTIGKKDFEFKLEGTNKPFTMSRNYRASACLENATKAKMPVELVVDTDAHLILECKLFSGDSWQARKKNEKSL